MIPVVDATYTALLGARRRQSLCGLRLPDGYEIFRDNVRNRYIVRGPPGFHEAIEAADAHRFPDLAREVQRMCFEDMHRRRREEFLQKEQAPRTATHMEMLRREQDRMLREHSHRAYAALAEPGILEKIQANLNPPEPDPDKMRPLDYLRARHRRWVDGVEVR